MADEISTQLELVLSALSCQRSRHVCYYLAADDIGEINDLFLAREIAAWETGITLKQVPTEKVTDILENLQNELLPRLDQSGLIIYDEGKGVVRYGSPPEPFGQILNICRSIDRPRE